MASCTQEAPLQVLDPNGAIEQIPDGATVKSDITDKNQNQDETAAPSLNEEQEKSSVGIEEMEEESKTPRQSVHHSRSLSLDSLMDGRMVSQNGTVSLSDDDANCSGIGGASFIGGSQLSPIQRSSEFGLKPDEQVVKDGKETKQQSVPTDSNLATSEGIVALSDAESAPEDAAEACDDSHHKENGGLPNETFLAIDSLGDDIIQLAQKQAGASAQAFIQGLRGAAHRRKMNLTRSRDSLAAKEKERREEAGRLAIQMALDADNSQRSEMEKASSPHDFRAKPLPRSTRMGGVAGLPRVVKRPVTTPLSPMLGTRRASMPDHMHQTEGENLQTRSEGVAGLPKVDKRPVTTPFSPLLGARRTSSTAVQTKLRKYTRQHDEPMENATFRARPIPKATVEKGGQSGVPKVSKRPTTIPSSPLLGTRRPEMIARRHSMIIGRQSGSASTVSDSTPLGLEFVNDSENMENALPETPTNKDARIPQFKEFQLQSTIRAKKRAEFDETRKQRWEARQREELHQRRERIRRLERELGELRWEL